ncbi:hypothetical protein B0H15DRAFT_799187 [Mycena belliarum]|uniref:Uncharacterized protein n=1 Tax=Mycena belliarum TaxID=1033014 RepID=A0AAD6UAG1_9AGAR|nr:hypothetical protein B0H15DRAFT_799187 [Mycena belliae]
MASNLAFLGLAPDVILAIFACCDIHTTCRYLHGFAFQKSVWLALIEDLKRRSILDCDIPDLQKLSTGELIALVKPLVTGPETWIPSDDDFTPEVSKQITLHPKIHNGLGICHWENEPKLFCGGRFVLFNNWHKLECCHVEIISLDLREGSHSLMLNIRVPDTPYDDAFSCPEICGEFASLMQSIRMSSYLRDVETHHDKLKRALLVLIPGYILLKRVAGREADTESIHLINGNDAIQQFGVSIAELLHSSMVRPAQLPKIISHSISLLSDPSTGPYFDQMSVRESPLQKGTYRLWVYISQKAIGHTADAMLYSHDLALSPTGPPQWRERSHVPAMPRMCSTRMVREINGFFHQHYTPCAGWWTYRTAEILFMSHHILEH